MTVGNVIKMPGARELPRSTPKALRSTMDTLLITPAWLGKVKIPPFQRECRITPRVLQFAEALRKNGGVIDGVITLGKLGAETYLIDGQHRMKGFELSNLEEGYADVRICHFESMADMGQEFVNLNSALVRMRNDDILRGLEGSNPYLGAIRRACPFVGYGYVRGLSKTMLLSMATGIRIWFGSAAAAPHPGPSSSDSVALLDDEQVRDMCGFLSLCHAAWGNDRENYRLWTSLNLGVLMWLYRRVVLGFDAPTGKATGAGRARALNKDQFGRCLLGISASASYSEWLIGRKLAERDRVPCYTRIKQIFTERLLALGVSAPRFPLGDWS